MNLYLHLVCGEVERDAGQGSVTISPISKETNGSVQQNNKEHACVKDTRAANEVSWGFHVVFKRHNNANPFQREDGGSEEHGQLSEVDNLSLLSVWRKILEDVIESDAHANGDEEIGHHGKGGEVFEIADQVDQNQRNQKNRHVIPNVVFARVGINDLLDVLGYETYVDAAAT